MKKLLLSVIALASMSFCASAEDEVVYETVKAFPPNERTATLGGFDGQGRGWRSYDNLGTAQPDVVFSLAGRSAENLKLEFDLYVKYNGAEDGVTFAGLPWGTKKEVTNNNNQTSTENVYSPFLSIDGDNNAKITFSDHGKAENFAKKYFADVKEGWNHMVINLNDGQFNAGTDLETSTFKKVSFQLGRVFNFDFTVKTNNFKITDHSNKVIFEQISDGSGVGVNTDDVNLTEASKSFDMPVWNGAGQGKDGADQNKGLSWGFGFKPAVDASEFEPKDIYFEFDFNIETEDADAKDFVKESTHKHFDFGQIELLNQAKADTYEINYNLVNLGFKSGENTYRIPLSAFNLNNQAEPFDYGKIAYGRMYMYFWTVETPFKATMSNPRIMVQKIVPVADVTDGINSIVTEENVNAPVEYFNLQGVRVANPESGLYIRRQGNKVTKVLVK